MKVCSIDDCASPVQARGWCVKHYYRWLRHGDTATVLGAPPAGRADRRVRVALNHVDPAKRAAAWASQVRFDAARERRK